MSFKMSVNCVFLFSFVFLKIFLGAFVPLYTGQLKSRQETGEREGE